MNWNWKKNSNSNKQPTLHAGMTDGQRRSFLKRGLCVLAAFMTGAAGLLQPLLALAERNSKAFTAETEADALAALFPDRKVMDSKDVHIDVHDVVENGAVVPLSITADLPDTRSITILVEKNPNPLIAKFNLGPECSGFIATRIKVAEPSHIIAVAEAQGKLYSTRKFVEVVIGGCG